MLQYEAVFDLKTRAAGNGYASLLKAVDDLGYRCSPRGLPTVEAMSVSYRLPLGIVERREAGNPAIGVVEGTGIAAGAPWDEVLGALTAVAPKTVANGMFGGSMSDYAGRMNGKPLVYFKRKELEGRQAVGVIAKHGQTGQDAPCTLAVQFRKRSALLDVDVFMRSQDLFLGLPTDTTMWTVVGTYLAKCHKIAPGLLTFHVSAAHIYQKHLGRIEEPTVVEKYTWWAVPTPWKLRSDLDFADDRLWMPAGIMREEADEV